MVLVQHCNSFTYISRDHLLSYFIPCVSGSNTPIDFFVGDVTSYTLHNLQPGTTYDVKVVAQYTGGMSGPLAGQGTTRMYTLSCFCQSSVLGFVLTHSSRVNVL